MTSEKEGASVYTIEFGESPHKAAQRWRQRAEKAEQQLRELVEAVREHKKQNMRKRPIDSMLYATLDRIEGTDKEATDGN